MILERVGEGPLGTFGVLKVGDVPFAVTLEPETTRRLAIPPGAYDCRRDFYHDGGYETFEITDVPNRSRILFHKGNTPENSRGCVLIGEEFGELNGKPAILASGRGFKEFMDKLDGVNAFRLEVLA